VRDAVRRCDTTISVRFSEPTTEQHGDDDEADRDFVGHHLRGRTQRAEERVLRVRRPAAHDDAVHAERGDGEDVEDADIDVGDAQPLLNGITAQAEMRQRSGDQRRQQEQHLVGEPPESPAP
jgi:hypothetical protein